jgi:hypothetical protein
VTPDAIYLNVSRGEISHRTGHDLDRGDDSLLPPIDDARPLPSPIVADPLDDSLRQGYLGLQVDGRTGIVGREETVEECKLALAAGGSWWQEGG